MMWGSWAHRRADEFDALVEGRIPADRAGAEDRRPLELVGALRAVPEVHARPEFVADLRERLMTEAATALVPDDLSRLRLPARRTGRERRLAALVGAVALAGATTSVAVASQSSLPGESLYPVKRVLESAHTSLSVGDDDKGRVQLSRATTRLDELVALAGQAPADDQRIARTLTAFTDQATRGADLLVADYAEHGHESSITRLRAFSTASLDRLEAVEPAIPYDARDELVTAAHLLTQIDAEAAQRCPTCDTAPPSTLPPGLAEEQIQLPAPSAVATDVPRAQPTRRPTSGLDTPAATRPVLPSVGAGVGPGSVQQPTAVPSGDPLRNLTHQLTQQLTQGLTGGAGAPSASARGGAGLPQIPVVGDVVEGVSELLQGALAPITGVPPTPRR